MLRIVKQINGTFTATLEYWTEDIDIEFAQKLAKLLKETVRELL